MILILTDDAAQTVAVRLERRLQVRGDQAELVNVSALDVAPCTGCNGCFTVSFGRCVVRDAMDALLPRFFDATVNVWMTGLTWGGVSYDIKKVMDKTAVIGDRFYYVHSGELVKGSQTPNEKWCVVGVKDAVSREEAAAFHAYARENGRILHVPHASGILSPDALEGDLDLLVAEVTA